MASANPATIQERPTSLSAPIFLIHDGGGTILNYYAIGDLGRNVYGISNAGPVVKTTWQDGVTSIAQEYCALIEEVGPVGPIILSGWSLGGLIALEMSSILAKKNQIEVLGVIIIETLYPPLVKRVGGSINEADLSYGHSISKDVRTKILQNLNQAAEVAKSHKISAEKVYAPTALMKALEPMPSRKDETVPSMLGWDEDGLDIVKAVYDIPGHHHSIFQDRNVDRLTETLAEICTMLENRVWDL